MGHNAQLQTPRCGSDSRPARTLNYPGLPSRRFYEIEAFFSIDQLMGNRHGLFA
jgi:hypothetical protein